MRLAKMRGWTFATIFAGTLVFAAVSGSAETDTAKSIRWAAQETPDDVQTESFQVDIPEIDTSSRAYIGGGGPSFWMAFFKLDELEQALNGVGEFDSDLQLGDRSVYLLQGGSGFGGRPFRTGGAGGGGSWTAPASENSAFDQAKLELGMGGLQIESLVAEDKGFGVSLGALLGRGSWTLTLSRNVNGSFSEVATEPTTLEMERPFWLGMPYASVEYKLLPFAGIKLSGGVGATLSFSDWRISEGTVTPGGPLQNKLFPVARVTLIFGN
ncbi:MAG: hypothetical protein ABEK03_00135 [Candidatus Bipolaricaulia bacterium]